MIMRAKSVVATILSIVCVGVPGAVEAQESEELYLLKVPIHLTQLSPEVTSIQLGCESSRSPWAPMRPTATASHELVPSNGRLDTTIVVRMLIRVPSQDAGKEGVYTCHI